jgi:phosphonate degradation associated HDIG domain protein
MSLTLDDISNLLITHGSNQYGGEAVSQLEHALQCAYLAERAQETEETIVAALLHDIGHLLSAENNGHLNKKDKNTDDLHQYIALPFIRSIFSDAVLEPIKLHVDAKRYLCAVDKTYWSTLSDASKQSLEVQGGVYSDSEAMAFETSSFGQEAVRLRRYDDLAKIPGALTPPLEHYLTIMHRVAN